MPFRSQLKEKAHKRHEEEKNHMATLQAVGISVSHYTGHSAKDDDNSISDEQNIDQADMDTSSPSFEDISDAIPDDSEPLLFFYDCETTGGSFHNDHIMEVASVVAVPDNVDISKQDFNSLCHTSRHIIQKGLYMC